MLRCSAHVFNLTRFWAMGPSLCERKDFPQEMRKRQSAPHFLGELQGVKVFSFFHMRALVVKRITWQECQAIDSVR